MFPREVSKCVIPMPTHVVIYIAVSRFNSQGRERDRERDTRHTGVEPRKGVEKITSHYCDLDEQYGCFRVRPSRLLADRNPPPSTTSSGCGDLRVSYDTLPNFGIRRHAKHNRRIKEAPMTALLSTLDVYLHWLFDERDLSVFVGQVAGRGT